MFARVLRDNAFWMKRAVIEALDGAFKSGGLIDEFSDASMHCIDSSFGVTTTRDAALIRHHDETKSRITKYFQRRGNTVKKSHE